MGQNSSSQKQPRGQTWAADTDGLTSSAGYSTGGLLATADYDPRERDSSHAAHEAESDSDVEEERDHFSGGALRPTALQIATAGPGKLLHPVIEASAPTWATDEMAPAAPGELTLAFAYGYTPATAGSNLHALPSGEIAFPCGKHVVLYDASRHAQRFLSAHDAPVRALAKHPLGGVLASGQASGAAQPIAIWRADAGSEAEPLARFGDGAAAGAGVAALAFSSNGQVLAALFGDAERTLVFYDWRGARSLGSARLGAGVGALAMAFSLGSESTLAVGGAQYLRLWQLRGGSLTSTGCELPTAEAEAEPQRRGRKPTLTALAWHPHGTLVAGTSRGEMLVFDGAALLRRYHAHLGPVFCLELPRGAPPDEAYVLSGGKDGRLRLWGAEAFTPQGGVPAGQRQVWATFSPPSLLPVAKRSP